MSDSVLACLWTTSCLAVLVMVVRIVWKISATGRQLSAGDILTIGALVCVFVRLGMIQTVLEYGNQNVTDEYRQTHQFTPDDISRRTIGSKLTIANRFFYNSYLWLQKLVLLDLYRRLYLSLPWERQLYIAYLTVFAVTYVGVQISNIAECQPVRLYWQVVPDPGQCAQAQVQLLVLGICNIVTDAMLLALPWPLLIKVKIGMRRKFELSVLFMLGFFIVIITAIRLPINDNHITSQVNRTTWASVELMAAAMVVNAPTLYSLYHQRRGNSEACSVDTSLGPPRVTLRASYFGPGSTADREAPAPHQGGWHGMFGAIRQTMSIHVVEENTATEHRTESTADLRELSISRTGGERSCTAVLDHHKSAG